MQPLKTTFRLNNKDRVNMLQAEKEFDALVRKKLTMYEQMPAETMWKRIEDNLVSAPVKVVPLNRPKFLTWMRAAAVIVAVGVGSVLFFVLRDSEKGVHVAKKPVSNKQTTPDFTAVPVLIESNNSLAEQKLPLQKEGAEPVLGEKVVTEYSVPQFISNTQVPSEEVVPEIIAPLEPIPSKIEEIILQPEGEQNVSTDVRRQTDKEKLKLLEKQ